MTIAYTVCAVYLVAAFITDIRSMKIPNAFTISAMVSGLLWFGMADGLEGLWFSMQGLAVGFIIMLLMYFMGAVGAGDVKLFGGIGAWCGAWFTLQAVFYSVLCAGVIGLAILLWRREAARRIRGMVWNAAGVFMLKTFSPWREGQKDLLRFPFMVAVVPGVIWAYVNQL